MKLTIFTPTYNRAYILENLYRSLQRQTCHKFEWLVIDDGSADDTRSLVEAWSREGNPFPIRYYYFENSGKPAEINRALDLADGELFFTVDSDDLLTPEAVEKILRWEKTLPGDGSFCAFAGSDGDPDGVPTNPIFGKPWLDATFFDRDPQSGNFIGYDRPWVFYTDIHRKYKYPSFPGERFITEAVAWNRMANDGYQLRCFDDVIYLWEHQEDGYSNSIKQVFLRNPRGYALWQKEWMEFQKYTALQKLKGYYAFYSDFHTILDCRQLSEYIGAPRWLMGLVRIIYQLKHR